MIPTQPIIVLIIIISGGVKFSIKIDESVLLSVQNELLDIKSAELILVWFPHSKTAMLKVSYPNIRAARILRTNSSYTVQPINIIPSRQTH